MEKLPDCAFVASEDEELHPPPPTNPLPTPSWGTRLAQPQFDTWGTDNISPGGGALPSPVICTITDVRVDDLRLTQGSRSPYTSRYGLVTGPVIIRQVTGQVTGPAGPGIRIRADHVTKADCLQIMGWGWVGGGGGVLTSVSYPTP